MAGAALTAGVLAIAATLAVGCATAGAVSVRSVRLSAVADAAALAAADTASGAISGVPCDRAHLVAARGGAQLESCSLDGPIAAVAVRMQLGPFALSARARAGPPPLDIGQ